MRLASRLLGRGGPRLGPGLEQNRHRLQALDDADAEGHEGDAPRPARCHRPLHPPRLRHTCAAPHGKGAQPGGGASRAGRPARVDFDREVERGLRLVNEHRIGTHTHALPRSVGRANLHMRRWAGGDCAVRQSEPEALYLECLSRGVRGDQHVTAEQRALAAELPQALSTDPTRLGALVPHCHSEQARLGKHLPDRVEAGSTGL